MNKEKLEIAKDAIRDLAIDFYYYDRKEDEELTLKDNETLTLEEKKELCDLFCEEFMKI